MKRLYVWYIQQRWHMHNRWGYSGPLQPLLILFTNIKVWIRKIYYKKFGFGEVCECGQSLYGGDFCMSFTHDEDVIQRERDKKLNTILK